MPNNNQQSPNKKVNFLLDFLPLVCFFLAFKFPPENIASSFFKTPMIFATGVLLVATALCWIISKIYGIKQDKINFYSNILLVIFGTLTLVFQNESFIKIKLTIFYSIIAAACFISNRKEKPAMKYIFGKAIEAHQDGWKRFTSQVGGFFIVIAVLNEVIWRNFSNDVWISFKVWILPFVTFATIFAFMFKLIKQGRVV